MIDPREAKQYNLLVACKATSSLTNLRRFILSFGLLLTTFNRLTCFSHNAPPCATLMFRIISRSAAEKILGWIDTQSFFTKKRVQSTKKTRFARVVNVTNSLYPTLKETPQLGLLNVRLTMVTMIFLCIKKVYTIAVNTQPPILLNQYRQ